MHGQSWSLLGNLLSALGAQSRMALTGAVCGQEMKLRNMQNQLKKYEKYIKKIPKEILDEIDAKERDKGKEMER